MGLPQTELEMWKAYLQNSEKGHTKKATIHVPEIQKSNKSTETK